MGHEEDLTHPGEPRGIDVFSDEEILKSERWGYDRKNNSALSVHHPPSYEVRNMFRRLLYIASVEAAIPLRNLFINRTR